MGSIQAWNGSSWQALTNIQAWNGSSWTQVQKALAWNGSSWVEAWVRSDPLTLTFNPIWTQSYAEDSHQVEFTFDDPASDVVQGDWDTVGHSHGTQRATGLMGFDSAAIRSAFGGRNVVKSARLRLTVQYQYTSGGIHPRLALRSGTGATKPAAWSHAHGDNTATGARTTDNNTVWTTIPTAGGQLLYDGSRTAIAAHDFGDGTDEASKELYRGGFFGLSGASSVRPLLELTADYI